MKCECAYEGGFKVKMCRACFDAMEQYKLIHGLKLRGMFPMFDASYRGYYAGQGFNVGLRPRTQISLSSSGYPDGGARTFQFGVSRGDNEKTGSVRKAA